MSEEKVFPEGFIVKRNERAPEWVLANVSVKMKDFIEWAKKHHKDGWVNLELLMSKKGKPYAVLNTFEPKKRSDAGFKDDKPYDEGDIPF